MTYRKSIVIPDVTPAADGVYTYDLPPGPLSFIDLVLKCLNVTDEATAAEVMALITKVEVLNNGESIYSSSYADLNALNAHLYGKQPILTNLVATDNATRYMVCRIPFGRIPYDPEECLPARAAGTLKLQLTVDIANAGADGLILQAECVELPEATPKSYLKCTTLEKTPSATGDLDVFLPTGNLYAGILIYATTVPTGTAWTATVDKIKILKDNVEHYIAQSYWEGLHGQTLEDCGMLAGYGISVTDDDYINYGFLNFTPAGGNQYLMETADAAIMTARITAGDTNAFRLMPLEIVQAK